jgi:hypothetical protein
VLVPRLGGMELASPRPQRRAGCGSTGREAAIFSFSDEFPKSGYCRLSVLIIFLAQSFQPGAAGSFELRGRQNQFLRRLKQLLGEAALRRSSATVTIRAWTLGFSTRIGFVCVASSDRIRKLPALINRC